MCFTRLPCAVLVIRRSQRQRCPRDHRHLALARAALRSNAAELVAVGSGGGHGSLLVRPAERGAVTPHPVQNDREFTGHGDGRLLVADLPGQPGTARFQRRPARHPVQNDTGRFIEICPRQPVAAAGNLAGIVGFARLEAARCQTNIGGSVSFRGKWCKCQANAYQKLYQATEIRSRSAATRRMWIARRCASETFWLM
jgi:hypothetical protein